MNKEFSNLNDKIEQSDFSSIFEFLKVIRYKDKKQKRYEQVVMKQYNDESASEIHSPGPQDILNKIFMSK